MSAASAGAVKKNRARPRLLEAPSVAAWSLPPSAQDRSTAAAWKSPQALEFDLSFEALVPIVSQMLIQIVARNDAQPVVPCALTVFHALKVPSIGILQYLERIVKYASCSPECLVLALVYLDRIVEQNPQIAISSLNVHRLLITAVMSAAKYHDDVFYNNAFYSKIGGIPAHEMNVLELEFMFLIRFSLHVPSDVFAQYARWLL